MPKLNFYDKDELKEFLLDILIENAQLRDELDRVKPLSLEWFNSYNELSEKMEQLKARVEPLREHEEKDENWKGVYDNE